MVYSGKENGHDGALGGQLGSRKHDASTEVCVSVCIYAYVMCASIHLCCCDCVGALLCGLQRDARDFKAMKSSKAACFMGV